MEGLFGTKRKELAGKTASLKIKTGMENVITLLKKETGEYDITLIMHLREDCTTQRKVIEGFYDRQKKRTGREDGITQNKVMEGFYHHSMKITDREDCITQIRTDVGNVIILAKKT